MPSCNIFWKVQFTNEWLCVILKYGPYDLVSNNKASIDPYCWLQNPKDHIKRFMEVAKLGFENLACISN